MHLRSRPTPNRRPQTGSALLPQLRPGPALVRFVGLLLVALASIAGAQNTRPIDSIVAVVEEDVILRSELDRAVDRVFKQFAGTNRSMPDRSVLEKQVLDQLVLIKLQVQRAKGTGIRVNEQEVDEGIARIASQAGLNTQQLRQAVTSEGMSWAEFRSEMRDEILTTRLRQRVADSRVNVTETEIDLFLAADKIDAGEYRLSHILIGIPEGASPEQIEAARQHADRIYAEIQSGMDFTTAAITYSDGQQALDGGDLGWRSADQVPSMFASLIGGMRVGEFSRPVRSASGFHILKLVDRRAQSPRMVEEYRAGHIMVEANELVSESEARDIIHDIHRRLLDGEDFAGLAKQFSNDTSSANLGGDMGWFQPEAFGPRVRDVLDRLEDGEISDPFKSPIGWHIMKKTGERRQDRTDDYLRAQARQNLRQQKSEEELQLFLRQMRDEAYIEYRI